MRLASSELEQAVDVALGGAQRGKPRLHRLDREAHFQRIDRWPGLVSPRIEIGVLGRVPRGTCRVLASAA